MSSFKTKTIALIASSLIVAVAGLSFATTPAEANTTKKASVAPKSTQTNKLGKWHPNYAKKPSSAPKAKVEGRKPVSPSQHDPSIAILPVR